MIEKIIRALGGYDSDGNSVFTAHTGAISPVESALFPGTTF